MMKRQESLNGSTAATAMTPDQSQQYDLGHQAWHHGYGPEHCPLPISDPRRCAWIAGNVDADLEAGYREFWVTYTIGEIEND